MPKRKKKILSEISSFTVDVNKFNISVDASINYEVRDPYHFLEDAKVFKFVSKIEINGMFSGTDERIGHEFQLSIYGAESRYSDFSLTLADCHLRDEMGTPKYRKSKGKQIPIYDVPKGIGYYERRRGTENWAGVVWVSAQSVSDMMILLAQVKPLYISIHEHRLGRVRWILGLALQNNHPDEE